MVKVAGSLARELIKVIMESGEVDMYDVYAVLEYAERHGFVVASRAIQAKPEWYLRCVNEGMQVCD
jgi:hypothetical protein